jgi:hypothetical protein
MELRVQRADKTSMQASITEARPINGMIVEITGLNDDCGQRQIPGKMTLQLDTDRQTRMMNGGKKEYVVFAYVGGIRTGLSLL